MAEVSIAHRKPNRDGAGHAFVPMRSEASGCGVQTPFLFPLACPFFSPFLFPVVLAPLLLVLEPPLPPATYPLQFHIAVTLQLPVPYSYQTLSVTCPSQLPISSLPLALQFTCREMFRKP